jgi:hypothetical protein
VKVRNKQESIVTGSIQSFSIYSGECQGDTCPLLPSFDDGAFDASATSGAISRSLERPLPGMFLLPLRLGQGSAT